jgi:hypothetical protein
MSPIPEMSSILLTQSSSRGKFAKLLCSVHRFHKGSFFKRLQVFFHFGDVDSTALHLSIEMIQSIEHISLVGQNENDVGTLAKTGLIPHAWQKHDSAHFPRISTER